MVPIRVFLLDNYPKLVYNAIMDVQLPKLEEFKNLEPITAQIVEPKDTYLQAAKEHAALMDEAKEIAKQEKLKALAAWAIKKKIVSGTNPPEERQLNRIYRKLKKGLPIIKAIKGVCSYPTWNKWKEEFPEVAAMEEQANAVAIDRMLDRKEELAARPGTHMGEIARDKVQMDELQNRIDRIDRLTEIRNKKNSAFGGSVVPIQINFGFGKK